MGDFLKGRYVAAWEKIGSFDILPTTPNGAPVKVGGNVAAYFCTPDLRVLGAAAGPVEPARFLEEARRASELAERTANGRSKDAREVVAASHERCRDLSGGSRERRHLYDILFAHPLTPLSMIRREVFEGLLQQTLSDAPVRDRGSFEFDLERFSPSRAPSSPP